MKTKTFKVMIASGLIALGASGVGVGAVAAHGGSNHDQFIKQLAAKLGTSESELKQVFDEVRNQRHQERLTQISARMDAAIAQGSINQAQKTAILSKLDAVHQEKMTGSTDKIGHRSAKRQEWRAFASQQGIEEALLWELLAAPISKPR